MEYLEPKTIEVRRTAGGRRVNFKKIHNIEHAQNELGYRLEYYQSKSVSGIGMLLCIITLGLYCPFYTTLYFMDERLSKHKEPLKFD